MTIHESLFQVLTSIVKKYQMDDDQTITNPAQRKESWIQITNDYIRETGDNISSKQLQKRWHNQKQKQRREARLEGLENQVQAGNSNGVSRRNLVKRIKSEHEGDGNDPLENFETQWDSDSNFHMEQSGSAGDQNQSVYDQDDESYRIKELHEIKLKILMAQAAEAEIKCEEAQYRKEEAKFKRDLAKLQFMSAKAKIPSSVDIANSSKIDNYHNVTDGMPTNSGSESAQK